MIKLKKVSKAILSVFLFILAFSTTVFAAEIEIDTDVINMLQESENIRLMTKEEYFQVIAKSRDISVKEAEKITNKIIANHQRRIKQVGESSENDDDISRSIKWGTDYRDEAGGYYNFAWVFKRVDAGGGMLVEASVPVIIYVYNSYGREFIEVNEDDCKAYAVGNGDYTYKSISARAKLIKDKVHLNTSGVVEVKKSAAADMGISIEQLVNFGFSISGDRYARKTVTISHVEDLYG
ncbi:hypothetical protein [Clostridium brassicae]|uniref:Uncharacterized protein n=1 Tax=Clostridium brassicae TaxID=2999072 RepID=A0ABT4DD75_9CLOT|nr:hypothetical protein [Clostridium brassicae]MCY6960247.1 hypothetical protein [Clostridium brassicae]